ncbi:MAG: AMP-binding protein [Gammaproteobacteria bacterium]|nr:AMP-binding protein [Gammaproteobacteria bacterium]
MEWYRKRTLGQLVDEAALRWGNREALVFGDRRWTWAEFKRETDAVAKGLMALGVEPEERVALWMTNRPEWLWLMFAIAKVGACIVPLNTRYRTDDVAYTVTQSRSATLITLDRSGPVDYQGMLIDSMPAITRRADGSLSVENYPDIRRLVVLGEARLPHALDWAALIAGGERITDDVLAARLQAVDPDWLMMIAYTSGTTGHPKGVMHSHAPIRSVHERGQLLGQTMAEIHVNYLPLFHVYSYSEIALMCALTGGKQILMEAFDAERALDLAEREGATFLHGFETHWADLLVVQARKPRKLSIRMGTLPAGQASTIPIAEKVQDVFCPTISGFGMSEVWAYVACNNPSHTREQRVYASGYPMNDYEFKVIDPATGREQPLGGQGELLIKGYGIMKGYWDKPDATAATLIDGWVHSGDTAYLREDGHLVFMGRAKDMLKVGGENVSPAEIEAYLRNMVEIQDASVVAYPDPRLSEVPVAFVILKPDQKVGADTLLERMKGRIASFKIPRHVIFV